MNIILLTSSKSASGGTRQAVYLAEGLRAKGHTVTFFAPPHCELREKNPDLNWQDLPDNFWAAKKTIERHFLKHEPNIVHAFHNRGLKFAAYGGSLWRLAGLPVACAAHRGVIYKPNNPLPYILPGIERFIVNSKACADTLPLFWRKNKVSVVYNCIPEARITPQINPKNMREELDIAPDHKILLCVANNTKVKGVTWLLQAFAQIQQKNITLVLLGLDPPRWQEQCASLGIANNVRLLSPRNNVADYLNIADVFVLPSLQESQPNVLLEAMCMGLPAVCTNVGGVPEILPNKELLCAPANAQDLAARLELVLKDDSLRGKAAAANLAQSKMFSQDYRVARVEEIYRDLCASLQTDTGQAHTEQRPKADITNARSTGLKKLLQKIKLYSKLNISAYSKKFYAKQSPKSEQSAKIVLEKLLSLTGDLPNVIDLGCGLGTWLSFFHQKGARVVGVDGAHIDKNLLRIPSESFRCLNLASGNFSGLTEKFDLAMSLEVAEHLPEEAADAFIEKLCSLADIVLFSAAIPMQRGTSHVNCQWQSYWQKKFEHNGFVGVDTLRKKIWDIEGVVAHYKQNIILYLKKDTALYNTLQADSDFIYDVVHPETYLMHAMDAEHHKSKRLNIILQRFFRRLFAFLY